MTFRYRKPVEIDPVTRQVRAVKGFGDELDKEMARVTKDLRRKGRDLVPTETRVLDSLVKGSFQHNISETTQGLVKIAYLSTVWAVGDAFISTAAGIRYRKWLDAEPTAEAFAAADLHPLGKSLFKIQGNQTQHHIVCAIAGQTVLTGVRLFNEPLFEIALAVEVPELDLLDGYGRLVTIDTATKSYEDEMLSP